MNDDTVVVQLILRPASGRRITGASLITASNLAEYTPSPEAAAAVTQAFRSAGFIVGPLVGISMAVSGPSHLIQNYFRTAIEVTAHRGCFAIDPSGRRIRELPLTSVPGGVVEHLEAATFEPPGEIVDQRAWP